MQVGFSTDFEDWDLALRICEVNAKEEVSIFFTKGTRWLGKQPDLLFISKKKSGNKKKVLDRML